MFKVATSMDTVHSAKNTRNMWKRKLEATDLSDHKAVYINFFNKQHERTFSMMQQYVSAELAVIQLHAGFQSRIRTEHLDDAEDSLLGLLPCFFSANNVSMYLCLLLISL